MVSEVAHLEGVKTIGGSFKFGESVPEAEEERNSRERLLEFSLLAVDVGLQGDLFLVFINDDVDGF